MSPKQKAAALWYAEHGFHVFPTHWIDDGKCTCRKSDCGSPGKHPIPRNGHLEATINRAQIEGWWREPANIAISCGPSGLAVVDIDPRHGGDETWAALVASLPHPLPDTVRTLTPSGGLHVWFRSPGEISSGNNKLGPGVDIKSLGGYVLAPPSNHLLGEYRFEVGYSPAEIEVAPLPASLVALLQNSRNATTGAGGSIDSAAVLAGVPEGQRDEQLFKFACKLRGAGIPVDMARKLVLEAAAKCKPAFPADKAADKVDRAYTVYPEPEERKTQSAGDVWSKARTAKDFIAAESQEADWIVRNLIVRQAVTVIVSPRGLCKTHFLLALVVAKATGGFFLGEKLEPGKVLLLDRDNPPAELKRRLKAWGAGDLTNLDVMKRDEVPPLTDAKAWATFPFSKYELVALDSLSSAMETVKDGEGGDNGKAIASLLDTGRKGPGILALANTRKDGQVLRGSGVIGDRVDIVYEVRDATDLPLDAKKESWIDCLPPAGEAEWASRSKRRKRRPSYRLAFVPSKFRLAEEPDPFILEVRLPDEGEWTVADVTADVELEHEQAKGTAIELRREKEREAVAALKAALPVPKRTTAVEILVNNGVGRNRARAIIDAGIGRDWIVRGKGTKADPHYIYSILSAHYFRNENGCESRGSDDPIPAGLLPQGRPESDSKSPSAPRASEIADSGRYVHSYTDNGVSAGIPAAQENPVKIRPNSGQRQSQTALHLEQGGRNPGDLAATIDCVAAMFPGSSFLSVHQRGIFRGPMRPVKPGAPADAEVGDRFLAALRYAGRDSEKAEIDRVAAADGWVA